MDIAELCSDLASLQAENAELEQLLDLTNSLSAKRSLPELLQASVEAAVALSGASSADLQLYDAATDTLRLAAHTGFNAAALDQFEWARRAIHLICREVIRSGAPVAVENVSQSALFRESPEGLALLGTGVRALLATPIAARQGSLLAVVTTCWREPPREPATAQRMLLRLARQLGALIEPRLIEQRGAARDWQRQQAILHATQRETDEFIVMLGYELRDPLSPMLTSLQLMELRKSEMFAAERRIIARQIQHLSRLADDVQEAARIALGRIELVRAPQELQGVVAEVRRRAALLLQERRVQLRLELEPRLTLHADRDRLVQLLVNLVLNAARHSPAGGCVQLRAERQGGQICIGVADAGVGSRPELRAGVLDASAPARAAYDRASQGLSLGLTIVQKLVAMHGGSIETRSAERNQGNEILVRLPASDGDVTQPERVSESPQQCQKPPPRRVLIVEDNRDAAESLASALAILGYSVEVAHDGPSALTKLQRFSPEIALVDIGLPVMGGYELAQRIRAEKRSTIRLLAVTAYGQNDDRQRSAAAGFEAHLVKPVDLGVLEGAMQGSPVTG